MSGATISDEYLRLQQELHQNPNYGTASLFFAPVVADLIRQTRARSLSDYGAGKKNLLKGLEQVGAPIPEYLPYDPAFPDYGPPRPADLVCCIDVLEHIEPELLENVLRDLYAITMRFGFFSVHTGPAVKTLADGRNAHLIQQPSAWWVDRLSEYFDVLQVQRVQTEAEGFCVLVRRIAMPGAG